MTSELQQRKERYVVRQRRQKMARIAGLLTMFLGYGLLAIYPDTPFEWVMLRVTLGFTCLLIGFFLAIVPWLSRIMGGNGD